LESSGSTLAVYPFKFKLIYTVILQDSSLTTELAVYNLDTKVMPYQNLFHTYFKVDAKSVQVGDLKGLKCSDSLTDKEFDESNSMIGIDREVDRIYSPAPAKIHLKSNDATYLVDQSGFKDVVVWNPWIEKSKKMR
jgi:glucose-6-phosphate 1-epimerase